ncbi:9713_t:CDS:2, partial [Scutellospora calospora]
KSTSSISWVEEITEKTFSKTFSSSSLDLSQNIMIDVEDIRMSKKKDSENDQDNVSKNNKLISRSFCRSKNQSETENIEKIKESSKSSFAVISTSDLEFINDSSVSDTNDLMICESPISEPPNNLSIKRITLNETNSDIRRSWSQLEVRHIKGLFSRKRNIFDWKRRNSYAYTNSTKTNQQLVSESEILIQDSPIFDIIALQADVEKETDIVTRSSQMRKFISCEIYSTEQSYLSHLKNLKKIFMDPFIAAAQNPNPLVNPDDTEIIFAHIEDLTELSTVIVEDLESSMDPWQESESMVGEVFLKYSPYFEALLLYAENHQQSRLAIERANENVLCRKFIQKYTPENHMDYDDLCHAVDNMKALALKCDKAIRQH